MQVIKKRIIINEGINAEAALGAALAFHHNYVENPEPGAKTGPYHSRTYLCNVGDETVELKVYQTKTSIIVSSADPEIKSDEGAKADEEAKTDENV